MINSYIDHTILKPNIVESDVIRVCEEAKKYNFKSVCVNSCFCKMVADYLKNSNIKTCVVIGFPLGANITEVKVYEAKKSIEYGADEIDMVINIGALIDGKFDIVYNDIKSVYDAIKNKSDKLILKVIIETCLLNKDQILKICQICNEIGVDFVKTSTGFSKEGAKVEDIKLMRKVLDDKIRIKASGGIRTYKKAVDMINAGADRLGTSSSIDIVEYNNA